MPSHLPPSTQPWRIPIRRRHEPRAARGESGYQSYRQCLRWEFGFSCPFCLLHEADLFAADIEGTGLTWIEHYLSKGLQLHDRLMERARDNADPSLVTIAQEMWAGFKLAAQVRERFAAVPEREAVCLCPGDACSLPEVLAEQLE